LQAFLFCAPQITSQLTNELRVASVKKCNANGYL